MLNDELNRISMLQGKMPIDGSKIEGDPMAEPSPIPGPDELMRQAQVPFLKPPQEPEDELEDEYDLLPDELPEPVRPAAPDLAVISTQGQCGASLMGRDVALTAAEEARVKAIVIGALRRSLREQEAELSSLLPKRVRRKAVESVDRKAAGGAHPVPPPPSPKRRGRPRKVHQALGGTETPL